MTSLPLTLSYDNLVTTNKHTVTTTSKIVADSFDKLHKDVLRKIEQLSFEIPIDWYKRNFTPIQIETDLGQNRSRLDKAYEITKDGFMLLVMGFTGKKAMEVKIRFIQAFNWAFEQIQRTTSHQRDVLIRACEKLSVGKMSRPQAYALVANEFGYEKPIDIPVELIPEATAFAYETLLRLKPVETTPAEPISPQATNEFKMFWKHVGLKQYDEMSKAVSELKDTMRLAEGQLKQVTKSQSLIHDALSEPQHEVGGKEKVAQLYYKALDFVARQNAMKY